MHRDRTRHSASGVLFSAPALLALLALSACGGGTPAVSGGPAPASTSEAAWRRLATPRPAPLPGAPRVSVSDVQILAQGHLGLAPTADVNLGVAELVAAGLLRRQDVQFVERRRFAAALEAEQRGRPRGPGAPPVGESAGAEYLLSATWSSLGLDSAYLDVRLSDAETGAVVGKRRVATPNDADPTGVARTVVGSLLVILGDLDRRPEWNDAVPASAPASYRPSGVPTAAVDDFLAGLAAEDAWNWDAARQGYESALKVGGQGFFEATAALARTARLRLGGTLGAS